MAYPRAGVYPRARYVKVWCCRSVRIIADEVIEQGKSKPVKVYRGGEKSEGAKLWSLKVEKDGLCTGCGGKRTVERSE
jgi:hypothetical protein